MGCISSLGVNTSAAWKSARSGACGISRVPVEAQNQPELVFKGLSAGISSCDFRNLEERFGRKTINGVDRVSNLAALATLEALDDASLSPGTPEVEAASVLYGTASGGNASIEAGYQRLFDARAVSVHPLSIPRYMSSGSTSHISMLFGIRGPCFGISSACASSAHAIGEGMHLIRSGRARIVIAGGSDASLTYGSLHGWRALHAMSDDGCRPFSLGRSGTVIGEGAATLVLEEEDSAQRRGVRIYAELAGYGASSDASHLTKPDTASAVRAIMAAHSDADLPLTSPLLISSHGTGTTINDSSEAAALNSVYGKHIHACTVIATKSGHGHMLGASGAMELVLAVLALRHKVAPPVLGFLAKDPQCDLPLALSAVSIDQQVAISTSFAFGGLNCALIAKAARSV
jgi:nodulation protein E